MTVSTKVYRNGQAGFNLIELLIVVAIISIIAAIAYPSYQDQVRKGRRADGQEALMTIQTAQERYNYDHNTYTVDLTELNYAQATDLVIGDGTYKVSVLAATTGCPLDSCYVLQATPITDVQLKDGIMRLTSKGLYFRDKNQDGDVADAGEDQW